MENNLNSEQWRTEHLGDTVDFSEHLHHHWQC